MGYQWLRDRRFKAFLSGLNGAVDELPREDRERFESYINSERGGELLADFAEQAVRTRSKTALAALAVLFADPHADAERKTETAVALDGVSEQILDVFWLLHQRRNQIQPNGGDIGGLTNIIATQDPVLRAAGWDGNVWLRAVDELVARGFLGADPSAAGRMGGEEEWSRYFRFTEESDRYATLVMRARAGVDTIRIIR